jgi:hypothetical protein
VAREPRTLVPATRYLRFQQERLARRAQRGLGGIVRTRLLQRADAGMQQLRLDRNREERPGIFNVPILGGLLGAGGSALGGALDVLGRPGQAVAGGALAVQAGTDPIQGALRAFTQTEDERRDLNFATLLERQGVENEWVRNIAGFAIGALTDPLNVFGIGAVRAAVGTGVRGVRGAIGATQPFRFGGLGDRAIAAITKFQQSVFDPAFLGREVRVDLRRSLQARGLSPKAADTLFKRGREIFALRRVGDKLAAADVHEGILNELIRVGTDGGQSIKDATTAANKLVGELAEGAGANESLFQFLDAMPISGITPGQAEAQARNAAEFATVRFLKSKYNRISEDEWGELAAMKMEMFGLVPMESLYLHRYMDPAAGLAKFIRTDSALHRPVSPSTISRKGIKTAEALRIYDPSTHVMANIGQDIAGTRLAYAAWKMTNDSMLRSLSGRRAGMVAKQRFNTRAELRGAGVDVAGWDSAMSRSFFSADGVQALAGEVADPKLRKLAERYLRSSEWRDEVRYTRAPSLLVLTKEQSQDALAVLGDAPEARFFKVDDEWLMPAPIGNALRTFNDSRKLSSALGFVDAFNSLWKPSVTVIWLGFHTRNIAGLGFLQWQMGMSPAEMKYWNPTALSLMTRKPMGIVQDVAGAGTGRGRALTETTEGLRIRIPTPDGPLVYTPAQLERIASEQNVIGVARDLMPTALEILGEEPTGVAGALVRLRRKLIGQRRPTEQLSGLEKMKELVMQQGQSIQQRLGYNPVRYMRTAGEAADNTAKMSAFMWRLSKGDTIEDAAGKVRNALFSYVESGQGVDAIATVFPFARWSRWNVPRQIEALLTQPQKASKVALLRGPSLESRDLEDEAIALPDWVIERFNVVLGKNEDGSLRVLSGLGIPIEDLNFAFVHTIDKTFGNLVADLSPILRAPLERAANHSFFTGEDIDDPSFQNYYARAWGWTENIPGLRDWLDIKQVEDPRTGRIRYRSNQPLNNYLLVSLIGRLGRTLQQGGEVVMTERGRVGNLFNTLTGVRVSDIFRPSPPEVELPKQLAEDPYLSSIYDQYQRIAVYPELGWQHSLVATRALNDVQDIARYIQGLNDQISDEQANAMALREHAQYDPKGAALVRVVRGRNLRQTGRKARTMFRNQFPELQALFSGIDPITRRRIEGIVGAG